jgi:hypothetical protein
MCSFAFSACNFSQHNNEIKIIFIKITTKEFREMTLINFTLTCDSDNIVSYNSMLDVSVKLIYIDDQLANYLFVPIAPKCNPTQYQCLSCCQIIKKSNL